MGKSGCAARTAFHRGRGLPNLGQAGYTQDTFCYTLLRGIPERIRPVRPFRADLAGLKGLWCRESFARRTLASILVCVQPRNDGRFAVALLLHSLAIIYSRENAMRICHFGPLANCGFEQALSHRERGL